MPINNTRLASKKTKGAKRMGKCKLLILKSVIIVLLFAGGAAYGDFDQKYKTSRDSDFLGRLAMAIVDVAGDIRAEDPATANHADRLVWAESVLEDPMAEARRIVYYVLNNATIETKLANSTDSELKFTVSGLVDTFAVP
jgi:hypothetical protein